MVSDASVRTGGVRESDPELRAPELTPSSFYFGFDDTFVDSSDERCQQKETPD